MRKILRKISAGFICLTMIMTLLMSVNVGADEGAAPSSSDNGTITVTNVKNETGVSVKAYQIVKANYVTGGIDGYVWTDQVKSLTGFADKEVVIDQEGVEESPVLNLSETDMAALAAVAREGSLGSGIDLGNGTAASNGTLTFTKDKQSIGTYLLLVEGADIETIYNPMLASIYYTVDGIVSGTVDASKDWSIGSFGVYAKSSEPTIDKEIVSENRQTGTGVGNGDHAGYGDTVDFKVKVTIPNYTGGQYTSPKVNVMDDLPDGLTLKDDSIKVKVAGIGVTEKNAAKLTKDDGYTLETPGTGTHTDKDFVVALTEKTILAYPGGTVYVTYSATVNNEATYNFEANVNKATLEYSNNPSDENSVNTKDDRTYHYTFSIDASIYGNTGTTINGKDDKTFTTHELIKVGDTFVEKTGTQTDEEFWEQTKSGDKKSALQGAEFTLYKAEKSGENLTIAKDSEGNEISVGTATSDENGALSFYRLDAGSYILKETKAPTGYSINKAEVPVVITAEFNENGTLAKYSIEVNGELTSEYTATYTDDTEDSGKKVVNTITTNTTTTTQTTYPFKNTKTPILPSTGGMGTWVFTFVGVAVMVGAAGFFLARRKKLC